MRIIYVPAPRSIRVHDLEPDATYRAAAFDPQSGKTAELGPITPDGNSSWTFQKDTAIKLGDKQITIESLDDWVVILERAE